MAARISRIISYVARAGFWVCIACVFLMMILGSADVIGRVVLNKPIYGTLEVFEILLPLIVLLGLANVQFHQRHVTIDIVFSLLSRGARNVLGLVTKTACLLVSVLILYKSVVMTFLYYEIGRKIPTIGIPIFIPQMLVPIGFFILSMVLASQIIELVEEMIRERKGVDV